MRKRLDDALERLYFIERDEGDKDSIATALREVGEIALEEGSVYDALEAFRKLDDKEGIRKSGELGLKSGKYKYDTAKAFVLLNDNDKIREILEKASSNGEIYILDMILRESELANRIYDGFHHFYEERGFENPVSFEIHGIFNAAANLTKNYNVGVCVAKGGLFSSYAFNVFGLPIIVTEAHRKGSSATFNWHDNPEDIKNKRVLVIDKDVVTGRTLRRTVKEIKKYSPNSIDLFLNHDPVKSRSEWGSHLESVPQEFNRVYTPCMFDYSTFPETFDRLKRMFN